MSWLRCFGSLLKEGVSYMFMNMAVIQVMHLYANITYTNSLYLLNAQNWKQSLRILSSFKFHFISYLVHSIRRGILERCISLK